MLNCLQIKSIFCATQEELQGELNALLAALGTRVQHVDFVQPLGEGFAAIVTYWSQDVPAAITTKIEEVLPEDGAQLHVVVLTEKERFGVLSYLVLSKAPEELVTKFRKEQLNNDD